MADDSRMHYTQVRLPAFTQAVHAAFRCSGISCYRVPQYTSGPTDARLGLLARNPHHALEQIGRALRRADVHGFHPVRDIGATPVSFGAPFDALPGDGAPEPDPVDFRADSRAA